MGSGNWLRSIVCLKKAKEDRSKRAKVHSSADRSNGATSSESNPLAVAGSSRRNPRPPAPEIAAIQIQNAFRAYMARKSLYRLKGAVRFNTLIQGHNVKRQTSSALGVIHSWCDIQNQIRARRLCMVTQGRIRQKNQENQMKLEAKIHELEAEWCGGSDTMEEILARIQQREEAAVKRERAMAYAFSHQWRANASQYLGQASFSLGKENWGWSWTERWVAARPWEVRVQSHANKPKKGNNNDNKQTSKSIKIKKLPENNSTDSARPPLSNGKETAKTKTGLSPAS